MFMNYACKYCFVYFMHITKDEDNLKFRNNKTQLLVNCANNHPITCLFGGQLYVVNEQKGDVYKK